MEDTELSFTEEKHIRLVLDRVCANAGNLNRPKFRRTCVPAISAMNEKQNEFKATVKEYEFKTMVKEYKLQNTQEQHLDCCFANAGDLEVEAMLRGLVPANRKSKKLTMDSLPIRGRQFHLWPQHF